MKLRHGLMSIVLVGTAIAATPAPALTAAGKSSAVAPDTRGTPPGEATRSLQIGTDIYEQERVATGPEGPAQLLFLDGSSATVGASGELVVDSFVYDRGSGAGKIGMSLAGGVMRFVGGRASKDGSVQVKTPTGTIGIRGGVALVRHNATTGVTEAFKQFGQEVRFTGNDGTVRSLTANGFGVTIGPSGAGPVVRWPSQHINELVQGLANPASRGSGAPPTDNQVNSVASTNSAQGPATTPPPFASPAVTNIIPPLVKEITNTIQQTAAEIPSAGAPIEAFQHTGISYLVTSKPNDIYPSVDVVQGIFFDQGNHATAFRFYDGQTPAAGSTKRVDTGGDAFIQWARWTDGTTGGISNTGPITLNANQSIHGVLISPTPTVSMPGSGSITYSLMGATMPTFADGGGAPGTLTSGSMTAYFSGSSVSGSVSLGVSMPGDSNYNANITISGSGNVFGGSGTFTGSGRACSGSCSAYLDGAFAGPGALRAGVGYVLGSGATAINGVAAFKQ